MFILVFVEQSLRLIKVEYAQSLHSAKVPFSASPSTGGGYRGGFTNLHFHASS